MGRSNPGLRAGLLIAMLLAGWVAAAPPASAVTYTNATLLIRWDGAGCVGSITGTSLTAFADATQNAYDKLAYWPGTSYSTRCVGETIQISFTNLAKWEAVGNILYVFSVRVTDASGTVSYFTNYNLKLSCSGTNYVHAEAVTCNDPGPSKYLAVKNNLPSNPSITSLYPDYPDGEHSLYVTWSGPSSIPLDFDWWEVHMSKTPGFTPKYSFPKTLIARKTWGTNHMSVTGLESGTQYCFRIRNADRFWEPDNFLTDDHASYGESAERCAYTKSENLRVTSPNGGEVWSHAHSVTWVGGAPNFKIEISKDGGSSYTTLATGVTTRSTTWDTADGRWPDGTNYRVRVSDASNNDVSDALFTVDNTPPETTADVQGNTCNGWFIEPPTVTLSATDNLAGVRNTYWAVDNGSTSTYTGPFVLSGDGSRHFEFWSDDKADIPNLEARKLQWVKIDTLPPVTSISFGKPSFNGSRIYVNSSTPFNLLGKDAGSGLNHTEYRVNGGAWTRYGGNFQLTGPDGVYTIGYRSADRACHLEDEKTFQVFLDNTRPLVSFDNPKPGSIVVDDTKVEGLSDLLKLLETLKGSLPPEVRAQVDALQAQVEGVKKQLPISEKQLCEIARILAKGLRESGVPEDVARLVENLFCAKQSSDAAVVAGTVTVRANAEDPIVNGDASGMNRVEFYVDGVHRSTDTTAPYEWRWNTTAEKPGNHELKVVAYDNLDQATEAKQTAVVLPTGPGNLDAILNEIDPLWKLLKKTVDDVRKQVDAAIAQSPAPDWVKELIGFVRAQFPLPGLPDSPPKPPVAPGIPPIPAP